MKRQLASLATLFCLNLLCLHAEATPVHSKTLEQEQEDVSVPISQTDIESSLQTRINQPEKYPGSTDAIEVGVSSWAPKNLAFSSSVANPSTFGTQVPELEFSYITPMHLSASENFNWKFGMGLMSFTRDEAFAVGAQNVTDQQNAYLASLKFGAEYLPKQFSNKTFSPYASLALVPTFITTSRSTISDGSSQFGVPVELQTGALVHLIKSTDLNVGFDGVLGKAASSNLSGVGVNAGVRVSL